ncbi:hypothetical protein NYZ51_19545, partial [Acinetobacter baumannii]|nr:hypothetical protein [Acinetobacter baumannii]
AAVGRGQAARLLYTGDAIDADEARALGLAHHRAVDALSAAQALAARIAANAPAANRGLKRALDGAPGGETRFDAAFDSVELGE